jgi:hypothetical protein
LALNSAMAASARARSSDALEKRDEFHIATKDTMIATIETVVLIVSALG